MNFLRLVRDVHPAFDGADVPGEYVSLHRALKEMTEEEIAPSGLSGPDLRRIELPRREDFKTFRACVREALKRIEYPNHIVFIGNQVFDDALLAFAEEHSSFNESYLRDARSIRG